jgi:hypothetical protein
MERKQKERIQSGGDAVALYHIVYKQERFEESAQALFKLIQQAQRLRPGKKRILYLDIKGHRNSDGGFDNDMFELQDGFLLGVLSPYLSEIHCPIFNATNPKPQKNDIPPSLIVQDEKNIGY